MEKYKFLKKYFYNDIGEVENDNDNIHSHFFLPLKQDDIDDIKKLEEKLEIVFPHSLTEFYQILGLGQLYTKNRDDYMSRYAFLWPYEMLSLYFEEDDDEQNFGGLRIEASERLVDSNYLAFMEASEDDFFDINLNDETIWILGKKIADTLEEFLKKILDTPDYHMINQEFDMFPLNKASTQIECNQSHKYISFEKYIYDNIETAKGDVQNKNSHFFINVTQEELNNIKNIEQELNITIPQPLIDFYMNIGVGQLFLENSDKYSNIYRFLCVEEFLPLYLKKLDPTNKYFSYRGLAQRLLKKDKLFSFMVAGSSSLFQIHLKKHDIWYLDNKIANSLEDFLIQIFKNPNYPNKFI